MGFSRTYLILVLLFIFSGPAFAQEITPNEKASRYHRILQKKPGNATLFGRFVQSWLDTDSKEDLQKWLENSTTEGSPADWQILAALHDYLGQDQAALRALNEAIKAAPEAAPLRLTRAKLNARLLDFEAALRDLDTAAKDAKIGTEASKLKGIYLARAGRIEEALASWKALVDKLPKDEELREDLIEVQVVEGLFKEAAATATDLVAMTRDPYKKALRQLRLGDLQILGNNREAGLKTYETIVATTGADTWLEREVLAQIERIFLRDDDIKGLRAFYQKLNEAHPRRVSIRKALARQMAANKEIDEAIALFREVLKITPGDLGNREEFIAFLEAAEKWELAREELNELIKQRPLDPSLREHLVRLETSLKNPEGIKAALLEVRKLRAQNPEGLIAVASLYQQADLPKEAGELLREGKESFPDSDEITEALASFLIGNDGKAEALALWQKMAEGADREGLLRVARSLSSHGQQTEAFKLLQSRAGDFEKDPLFLTQICQLALTKEENATAVPLGKKLVELSTTPTDLENSVRLTRKLIIRSKKVQANLASEAKTIGERCLQASLTAHLGDLPHAVRILEEAEAKDSTQLAQFFRIRFEEEFGNTESAITLLRKIIATPNGRKTVHLRRLVHMLESTGDLEGALTAVEEWKKIAPGDQSAWIRRADLLLINGEPGKAATELRRLIGKFGADEENRARLAEALLDNGELRPARQIYERLYEEAEGLPAKLKWIYTLAGIADEEGTLPELLADFERRKRANPTSVAPLLAIAEIHREQRNYEQRRSALLEASRRRPDDLQLLLNIASEEERFGEFSRAISILEEAIKNDPGVTSKRRLANLHLRIGEIQTGLRILGEIPGENDDPRNLETTAIALVASREITAAMNHLQSHLNKHDNDWRLQYLLGVLLDLNQEYPKSIEVLTSLQNADQEIPGLSPILGPKGRHPVVSWQKPIKGTPHGWLELGHLTQLINQEHYQLLRILRGQRSQSSLATIIHLPGTAREARILSTLRAAKAAASLEDESEEQKAAMARLDLPEIPAYPLFKQRTMDQKEFLKMLADALEKKPDSVFHLRLWLRWDFNYGSDENDEKRKQALLKLSQANPIQAAELIHEAANEGLLEESDVAPLCELAFAATPPESLPQVLQLFYDLDNTLDYYSASTSTAVAGHILTHSLRLKKSPPDFSWIAAPLQYLIAKRDVARTVKLFNLIGDPGPKPGSASASLPSFGRGYRSGSSEVLTPPTFPQAWFSGYPYALSSTLRRQFEYQSNPAADKLNKLLAKLSPKHAKAKTQGPLVYLRGHEGEIEDPFLREIITAALSPKELLPKIAEKFSTASDSERLLFAAGYFFKEGEIEKSNTILLRLHLLPLSRQLRAQVDGHLTHLGAILKSRETPDFDSTPAVKAALRLRRLLFGEERDFLANHLVALGLTDEAKRVSKSSPQLRRSRSRKSSFTPGSGRYGVMGHILLNDRDSAIREGTKTLMGELRGNSSSYVNRTIGVLSSSQISEEVLAKLQPGNTASRSRQLDHAILAGRMGHQDIALKLYQKLLADKLDDHELRAQVLNLTPVADWKADEIDPKTLGKLAALLSNDFETVLKVMELTSEYLKKTPPLIEGNDDHLWVADFVNTWADESDFGLIKVTSLDKSDVIYFASDPESEKRWSTSFLRLLQAMLPHPGIATNAFVILSRGQKQLELSDEQLAGFARATFLKIIKAKPKKDTESSFANLFSPDHPIWDHLVGYEDTDFLFAESTMKALGENHHEGAATLFFIRLISIQPPKEALKTYLFWERGLPKIPEMAFAEIARFTYLLSRLKPPAGAWTEHLQKRILAIANESPDVNSPDLFANWASFLGMTKGNLAMINFLIDLFETHLPAHEKWPLFSEIGYDNVPEDLRQKLAFCSAVAGHHVYQDDGALTLPMEILLKRSSLAIPLERADNLLSVSGYDRDVFWYAAEGSPQSIADTIASMGILKKNDPADLPLQAILLMDAGFHPDRGIEDWESQLQKIIEAQEGNHPALQAIFITYILPNKQSGAHVTKLIEDHPELIKACQLKEPDTLENFLRYHPDPEGGPGDFILAEMQSERNINILKTVEPWLKEGIPLVSSDTQGNHIWYRANQLSTFDPELAADLVVQTLLDLKEWPKAREASISSGSGPEVFDAWATNLCNYLFDDMGSYEIPSKMIILDRLIRSKAMEFLNFPTESVDTSIGNILARWGDYQEVTIKNLKAWAPDLTPQQEASLMLMNLDDFPLPGAKDCLKVADRAEAELRPHSPVFADGLIFIALAKSLPQLSAAEKPSTFERLKKSRDALLAHLDYPPVARLHFLSKLASLDPLPGSLFADPDFAKETLSDLKKYLTSPRIPSRVTVSRLIEGLAKVDYSTQPERASDLIKFCQKHILAPESKLDRPAYFAKELIPTALAAGEQDFVRQWLSEDHSIGSGDCELLLTLASADFNDLVKKRLTTDPSEYRVYDPLFYQKDWPEKITRLLDLAPKDHRFAISLALSGSPDAWGQRAPTRDREARLDDLAQQALTQLPKDLEERLSMLHRLSQSPSRAAILREALVAEVAHLDLEVITLMSQEGNIRNLTDSLTAIMTQNILLDLADGKTEDPLRNFNSLATSRRYRSYGSISVMIHHLSEAFPTIITRAATGPVEAKEMATFAREIFDLTFKAEKLNMNFLASTLTLVVSTHALANDFETWEKHLASQSPEIQRWSRVMLTPNADYLLPFNELTLPPDSSLKFLTSLLSSKWVQTHLFPEGKNLGHIIDDSFATRDQLMAAARQMPDSDPLKAKYLEALEKNSF